MFLFSFDTKDCHESLSFDLLVYISLFTASTNIEKCSTPSLKMPIKILVWFCNNQSLRICRMFGFVMAGASFIWNMSVDMFGFVSADLEFVAVFGFVTSGALCHLEFVALFGFITTEKLFHLKFVAFFRFAMAEVLFHLEFVALFGSVMAKASFHLEFITFFGFVMSQVLFHLEFVALLIDSLTIQLYLCIKGKI